MRNSFISIGQCAQSASLHWILSGCRTCVSFSNWLVIQRSLLKKWFSPWIQAPGCSSSNTLPSIRHIHKWYAQRGLAIGAYKARNKYAQLIGSHFSLQSASHMTAALVSRLPRPPLQHSCFYFSLSPHHPQQTFWSPTPPLSQHLLAHALTHFYLIKYYRPTVSSD